MASIETTLDMASAHLEDQIEMLEEEVQDTVTIAVDQAQGQEWALDQVLWTNRPGGEGRGRGMVPLIRRDRIHIVTLAKGLGARCLHSTLRQLLGANGAPMPIVWKMERCEMTGGVRVRGNQDPYRRRQ